MLPESVTDVTAEKWEEEVIKSQLPAVVIFWAPWCQFCKALLPVFGDLAREYLGRMKFVRLNLEEYKELAEGYGIMSIPTLKFFCGGRPVYDVVGVLSREELKVILDGVLSIHQRCLTTSSPVYYV